MENIAPGCPEFKAVLAKGFGQWEVIRDPVRQGYQWHLIVHREGFVPDEFIKRVGLPETGRMVSEATFHDLSMQMKEASCQTFSA